MTFDLTRTFSTPMMTQYMGIKREYPDCILFFRLGDFYELFLEDALVGAKVLNITLTARPRGKDGEVPMAGVPYHAAEHYLAKLVKAGHKVAICEQITAPDKKGIVERAVVRIVTPGTVLNENSLAQKEHNHIASLSVSKKNDEVHTVGLAFADLSTGSFVCTQIKVENFQDFEQFLLRELLRFQPSECIISADLYEDSKILGLLRKIPQMNIFQFGNWEEFSSDAKNYIQQQFSIKSLRGFGIESKKEAVAASAVLLGYLNHTQQQTVSHIQNIQTYKPNEFVLLDRSTIVNLELFETLREGEKRGSLLSVIDKTTSAAGGRLLKKWLLHPLKNKQKIEQRLSSVEEFLFNRNSRTKIQGLLSELYDIERIVSKLSVGIGNPGDVINLKISLQKVLEIKSELSLLKSKLVKSVLLDISAEISTVISYIEKTILNEPKIDVRSGGIIAAGVNSRLDELREVSGGGKTWVKTFEQKERDRTGITSLKVKYNKVFGYYIEVSNSNLPSVPEEYYRKQTLVNAERFITEELKHYENLILNAEEEIGELEFKLFNEAVEEVLVYTKQLQKVAAAVASIDVVVGFASLSEEQNYNRPKIITKGNIKIAEGRHPVVEQLLEDSQFVPNDTLLNDTDHQLLLITGPNMAGKSVYMRQVALIVLLAHMGSFVPAKSAEISIVDRIFVRSGASDIIASGLSTFMVEMVETAHILNHATEKSLIIMDEIGRGTSTYDGISIAWAVAEYIVTSNQKAKTLFATHYHELQKLEEKYPKKIKKLSGSH
jgi:DNA mismatch repair protein MutS